VAGGESVQPDVELFAGEIPPERLGDLVVEAFELIDPPGDGGERVEVIGGQDLALDD